MISSRLLSQEEHCRLQKRVVAKGRERFGPLAPPVNFAILRNAIPTAPDVYVRDG